MAKAKIKQSSYMPTRKVKAAGLGAPVTVIVLWSLNQFGLEFSPEVAGAIGSLISFGMAYLAKELAD